MPSMCIPLPKRFLEITLKSWPVLLIFGFSKIALSLENSSLFFDKYSNKTETHSLESVEKLIPSSVISKAKSFCFSNSSNRSDISLFVFNSFAFGPVAGGGKNEVCSLSTPSVITGVEPSISETRLSKL